MARSLTLQIYAAVQVSPHTLSRQFGSPAILHWRRHRATGSSALAISEWHSDSLNASLTGSFAYFFTGTYFTLLIFGPIVLLILFATSLPSILAFIFAAIFAENTDNPCGRQGPLGESGTKLPHSYLGVGSQVKTMHSRTCCFD